MDLDDELIIELDDFDTDIEDEEPVSVTVPGKVAASLPLVSPTISPSPMVPVDYREDVALTKDADKLFDFTKTKLTPVQQMYIVGFATRGTKSGACHMAGVSLRIVDKWMENEEFSQALQNAVEIARDALEEELLRRAMNGSDKLLLEAVKATKPEKYNKKQSDINISGTMVHTWADLAKQATTPKEVIDTKFEEVGE